MVTVPIDYLDTEDQGEGEGDGDEDEGDEGDDRADRPRTMWRHCKIRKAEYENDKSVHHTSYRRSDTSGHLPVFKYTTQLTTLFTHKESYIKSCECHHVCSGVGLSTQNHFLI